MRAALVTEASWSYRYGLNAILNGLDYHGNVIDVHVICHQDVPDWYLQKASSVFDFGVYTYRLEDYMQKYPRESQHKTSLMTFYSYKLVQEIADKYDSVMITDADFLICGRLENYFRTVVGNDLLMIPSARAHGGIPIHMNEADSTLLRQALELHSGDGNFICTCSGPFISDPKRNTAFYEEVWRLSEGITTSSMRAFFYATFVQMDRVADVIGLPTAIWCVPISSVAPYELLVVNGKRCFFLYYDKVMMIHGRWWSQSYRDFYSKDRGAVAEANCKRFGAECKWINTEWKLPLEWLE
jgi:hypothetical protein